MVSLPDTGCGYQLLRPKIALGSLPFVPTQLSFLISHLDPPTPAAALPLLHLQGRMPASSRQNDPSRVQISPLPVHALGLPHFSKTAWPRRADGTDAQSSSPALTHALPLHSAVLRGLGSSCLASPLSSHVTSPGMLPATCSPDRIWEPCDTLCWQQGPVLHSRCPRW